MNQLEEQLQRVQADYADQITKLREEVERMQATHSRHAKVTEQKSQELEGKVNAVVNVLAGLKGKPQEEEQLKEMKAKHDQEEEQVRKAAVASVKEAFENRFS